MNFDEAINAHAAWKLKLSAYLRNPDKSLDAKKVAVDNQCALGKWLHGEGKAYSAQPEFAQALAEHARFHKAAASVVSKADAGVNVSEEVALGGQSDFATASMNLVRALMTLKTKAKAA